MAIAVVIETHIGRSPEAVYDEVAAIDRWPSWLIASGIQRIERTTDGPLLAGEALTVQQSAAGRSGTFAVTATVVERPTHLALSGRDVDGVSIEIEARLLPIDTGTRLRWSIRIGLPLRYRVFESIASPQVQRAAALDIEALKRRLESVASD
jgi:uncharacterized protein YndB with AHSA1/START domain